MPWECIAWCWNAKQEGYRLSNALLPGSSFHYFEQLGVWACERSHGLRQDNNERNPGMSSHTAWRVETFQIIPDDFTEGIMARVGRRASLIESLLTYFQSHRDGSFSFFPNYSRKFNPGKHLQIVCGETVLRGDWALQELSPPQDSILQHDAQ